MNIIEKFEENIDDDAQIELPGLKRCLSDEEVAAVHNYLIKKYNIKLDKEIYDKKT